MAFPAVTYTDNASAGAGLTNNAAQAGLSLTGLQPLAQLQSVVANLLADDPTTVDTPAGNVVHGTFGANITPADTGIYSFPAQVGIGLAGAADRMLRVGATVTASAGVAQGIVIGGTYVATANSDVLTGIAVGGAFTPGAFTGLQIKGVSVAAFTVATFTTPADPVGFDVGIITATGATNAFGHRIAPPTGATNNYLIAHTTPATFNVNAAGQVSATIIDVTGAPGVAAASHVTFGGVTRTTIGANGAATALTANPLGYIDINVAGTIAQIPYYNRGA